MPVRRIQYLCTCGTESSSSYTNYYRQLRVYGAAKCPGCVAQAKSAALSRAVRVKYDRLGRNSDRVEAICPVCNTPRAVSRRQARSATKCPGCAARENRARNHRLYDELAALRRGDPRFAAAVGLGVSDHMTDQWRRRNSAAHAALWADPEYRSRMMQLRAAEACRSAMQATWDLPGRRAAASAAATSRALQLWSSPEYRDKQAAARSRQNRVSTQQRWLHDLLADLAVEFVPEYPLGPYVFDCLLPGLSLLIEVQGDYWHSLPRARANDRAKATYVSKYFPEYRVVYFYEHEFYAHGAVQERLKYELGLSTPALVDFDFGDVVLRESTAAVVNDFLYKYHYIGPKAGAVSLGFWLGDELAACCSLAAVTRLESATRLGLGQAECRELARFCIHPRYQQKNFASWCLGRVRGWVRRNRPAWRVLVSFADSTVGHRGTIYKAAGWHPDGEAEPSHYYVSRDGFVMHKRTLYGRAVRMGMTEAAFAAEYGYSKRVTGVKSRYVCRVTN